MKLLPLAVAALALACTGKIGTPPGLIGQGLDGGLLPDGGPIGGPDAGPTPDAGPGWDAGWPDAGGCPPAFGGDGLTIAGGFSYPRHLAAAADRLFVTEVGVYNKPFGKLDAVFFDGGVTPLLTGLDSPDAVATDGTDVYWVDRQNGLQKMPAGGGTVVQLDTRVNGALEGLTALAWDGTSLVYATGSRYLELVKANGSTSNLFTGDAGTVVSSVAVEGTTAYFLVQGDAPGLYSVSLSGSPRPTQVLAEPAQGSSLALTATDFVWATGSGGSGKVQSHPRTGGATVDLASGLNGPGAVVPIGPEVYFQDSTTGSPASPWFFQVKTSCRAGPIPVGPVGQAVGDVVRSSDGSTLYFTSLVGTGQGYVGALP
jgi:hypothetical protein